MRSFGFTLAELLIALAILGVIATFAIPKLLNSQQDGKRISVFKEAIAMNVAILQDGIRKDALLGTGTEFKTFFMDRINFLKVCDTNALAQGCWTAAMGTPTDYNGPGGVLHSGAVIAGYNGSCAGGVCGDGIVIDWNGPAGPNTVGQDQLNLNMCYGTSDCSAAMLGGSGPKVPGAVGPRNTAANISLYEEIFAQ